MQLRATGFGAANEGKCDVGGITHDLTAHRSARSMVGILNINSGLAGADVLPFGVAEKIGPGPGE